MKKIRFSYSVLRNLRVKTLKEVSYNRKDFQEFLRKLDQLLRILHCWASAVEEGEIGPWTIWLCSKYFLLKMNSQKEKLTFSCVSCNGSYKSEQGLKQHYARTSCEAPPINVKQHRSMNQHRNNVNQHTKKSFWYHFWTIMKWRIIPGEDIRTYNFRKMLLSSTNRSFIGRKSVSSPDGKG